jgi:methylated-DNA-[protein]-cysteine S-methyltransferase
MTRHTTITTSDLGNILLVADDEGLRNVAMIGQRHFPGQLDDSLEDPADAVFAETRAQLEAYAAGRLREFDLPLAPRGTDFQLAVWERLRSIEFGDTTTYGALAMELGGVGGARAVGATVGRNPIGIIVPCHRVIGADGSLTGYAGGLERKRQLLELEGVLQPTLV